MMPEVLEVTSGLLCVRCSELFSRTSYPFGQLLACGPLCFGCLDDILEQARSWGGDDQEFEKRVKRRLEADGLAEPATARRSALDHDRHAVGLVTCIAEWA